MPASDYPRTGQCVKIYPMARKYFNPLLLFIYIFKVGYRTKKASKKVFLAALYYDLKTLTQLCRSHQPKFHSCIYK